MTLAPELGPIGRIGASLLPPKTARTELPSTTARDQSIFSRCQSRSTKWINSQMPACCQSRTRRQQDMPEPHPSSCGSISQGMPLRNTNRIPARHARSAKRGLPPLVFGFETGMKGLISSQACQARVPLPLDDPPESEDIPAQVGCGQIEVLLEPLKSKR